MVWQLLLLGNADATSVAEGRLPVAWHGEGSPPGGCTGAARGTEFKRLRKGVLFMRFHTRSFMRECIGKCHKGCLYLFIEKILFVGFSTFLFTSIKQFEIKTNVIGSRVLE